MYSLNPDLINDLAESRAAIFVGAGVSAGVTTNSGTRIRTWSKFLTDAADRLDSSQLKRHVLALVKQQDHLMACEMISRGLGLVEWQRILSEEYHQRASPSELQRLIMQLRQRIVLTTNFDLYLEAAWSEVNSNATHYPKVVKSISETSFQVFRDSKEYIFKVHGSIDDIESLIFTKKEYAEKAYGNWAYSKFIETILLTHTVLFVGFSLSDPAIAQIIEGYARNIPSARPHYIFLSGAHSEKFVEINKDMRRIFIVPYNKKDNHSELTAIFRQISLQVDARRRELAMKSLKSLVA